MSVSEAARLLGKHRSTVVSWIEAGAPVVQRAQREAGVGWQVDLGALLAWRETRAVAAERERMEARHSAEVERLEAALAGTEGKEAPISRAEALRRRAVADARLRELDLAVRESELASVDELERLVVDLFVTCRQRLLYLPGRLATELAAATEPADCHAIMDRGMREILEALAAGEVDGVIGATVEATQAAPGCDR